MYIKKIYQDGMNGKKKARHNLHVSGYFYLRKNVCFSCEVEHEQLKNHALYDP